MHTVRMNITLPGDVAARLKKIKNKSAFISESVQEKLEHLEEESLTRQLEGAYMEENAEDIEDARIWEEASADGIEEKEDETWRDIYRKF